MFPRAFMHSCRLFRGLAAGISASLIAHLYIANSVAQESGPAPSVQAIEDFEKHIRPLLVQHCYECHGPDDKPQGNLRLDAPDYWLIGGDTGPAIMPGDPEKSLFIKAVRYHDSELEMPPSGKLNAEVIAKFETWIRNGASAPPAIDPVKQKRTLDIEAGKSFWAYRPLPESVPIPEFESSSLHPIDAFLKQKLNQVELEPNALASREVIVRRLYFDLWGLPPTAEQIKQFVNDTDPSAYSRLVDTLLASRHFGERFGRHWLDIVRYGESLTLRGFIMPEAWRYRNFVIESFHRDYPINEFIREQIAGDLLEANGLEDRQRKLIATTFLTLGNTNLEEQDKKQLDMDVVDEQLDTIGKALLGQTIGCARCHDHKFDPIPTQDYYAMAGILRNAKLLDHANISKWTEVPLPLPKKEEQAFKAHEAELNEHEETVKKLKQQLKKLGSKDGDDEGNGKIIQPSALPGIVVDSDQAKRIGSWTESQYSGHFIGTGFLHDENRDKGEKTLTFEPELPADGKYEVRLAYVSAQNRCIDAPVTIFSADGEVTVRVNQTEPPPIDRRFISLGSYKFERTGQSYVMVTTEGTEGIINADAVQFLPVDVAALAANNIAVQDSEPEANASETAEQIKRIKADVKEMEKAIKQLQAGAPKRPKAMTVMDRSECADCPVHIRGSVHSLGDAVPRGFIQVASWQPAPKFSEQASGRKELAAWLVDDRNPLTPRVYVNRVWQALFGQGLVRTPDNFGATGRTPSHPELLDYLTIRFVEQGWSTKELVRFIVSSHAYQRSSHEQAKGLSVDPENQWLWRMSRKRLEAECIRDAILSINGTLIVESADSLIPTSLASDFGYTQTSSHRSVYLPVFRNAVSDLFEAFDVADSSMVVGQRNVSTVAPQALFMMNHPFVREQAEVAAKELLKEQSGKALDERIGYCFMQCFGRSPSAAEASLALRFLESQLQKHPAEVVWTDWYQSLFSSIDFRYRD